MPDQSERRRFPRCPIQLPLQHAQKSPPRSKIGGGWTQSLSEGGACVELDRPLSAPTWLHIRLQTDRGAIAVEAQVVWQGKPAADPAEQGIPHGVTFKHLSPAQRQALRDLLLAQRQERRLGVRLPVDLGVTCRPRGPAGPPLRGHTGDISRGGLLIRLSQVLLPGTALAPFNLLKNTSPRQGRSSGSIRDTGNHTGKKSGMGCVLPPPAGMPRWPWRASCWECRRGTRCSSLPGGVENPANPLLSVPEGK